uniref:Endonuclease/exonuclease/phosphatase domain-containing protein n=1 Tax=Equus caballus TaxID=9796 RepID=A0A9L0T8C3_HORSE
MELNQEDITLINIYEPKTGTPKCIKQLLTNLKGYINNNSIIVGDLNTSLTSMDRSSRQKVNKETEEFNDKLDQMDLIDIFRERNSIQNQQNTPSQVYMEHSQG